MKYLIVITSYFLITLYTIAQQNYIQGYVYDEETHQALPFANISISRNAGTITNSEGYFKFKFSDLLQFPVNITISYIGYESKQIEMENNSVINVYLTPKPAMIPEATVKADFIYSLLKKAFDMIPDNYPINGQRYKGFFRQTLYKQDSIVYLGEAYMDAYKSSYKIITADNQIDILKFRKFNTPENYEDSIWLIGGQFSFYSADIVKQRYPFLNPKYYDKLSYQYKNDIIYQNNSHFQLVFENENKSISGNMLINKNDYAYTNINFICFLNEKEGDFIIEKESINVNYKKIGNRYYLSSYDNESWFRHKNSDIVFKVKILYTAIETDYNEVKPIPFEKTIKFDAALMNEEIDTSEFFWEDYNIIPYDKAINTFIKQNKSWSEPKSLVYYLYKLKNFNYSIGIGQHRMSEKLLANQIQVKLLNDIYSSSPLLYSNKPVLYGYFSVGYQFAKKFGLQYTIMKDKFSHYNFIYRDISIEHRTRIKNFGTPYFLNAEIGISMFKNKYYPLFEEQSEYFSNNNLIYSGIKGNNINISTGLTSFFTKSVAAKVEIQASWLYSYSLNIKYELQSQNYSYKPVNTERITFQDRLNLSIAVGLCYYLNYY